MEFKHFPVMLNECMEALNLKDGGYYFDGTLGGGSHTREILKRTNGSTLVATDLDIVAIKNSESIKNLHGERFIAVHDNFKNFSSIANDLQISGFDGILLDLGVSSMQLDIRERGFSYLGKDERLDMRMNQEQELSAYEVVNFYSEKKLVEILRDFGEEKFCHKIVSEICKKRQEKPIVTCGELVEIIDRCIPYKFKKDSHPAKKTFQALRICVNGELDGLKDVLYEMVDRLNRGGRLAVITFHSLEDRIVKSVFKDLSTGCTCDRRLPVCVCGRTEKVKEITKKPITASLEELEINSRSKSAKLRVVEKL